MAKILDENIKIGLVLSGGGAKGAYQAGVIRCLADFGVEISAISGASVGSLNGALIASARNLYDAADRLETVWTAIAACPPAEIKIARAVPGLALSMYLSMLVASGQQITSDLFKNAMFKMVFGNSSLKKTVDENAILALFMKILANYDPKNDLSLSELVSQLLDDDALGQGLPLYISVFRSRGVLMNLAWAVAGATNLAETPDSEFLHLQSQKKSDFKKCILASAALPLIFEAQSIGGRKYTDGGIGGWWNVQGNTPITPLLKDAGCKCVIVTHLNDGSLWNRHSFPDTTILEIRPGRPIARKGGLRDTLGFDSTIIQEWILQGYEDTYRCLSETKQVLDVVSAGRETQQLIDEILSEM